MEFAQIKSISAEYGHTRPILVELFAVTVYDDTPDLSWLETSDEPCDAQRLADYGETWHMLGVRVVVKFVVPRAGHQFYIHEHMIKSAGLWGIESDSDSEYLESVANDEWHELQDELRMMNVAIPSQITLEYRF